MSSIRWNSVNPKQTEEDNGNSNDINNNSNNGDDHDDEEEQRKIVTRMEQRNILYQDLSPHDKKKERKKFLKRLLKCHQQYELSRKLNAASLPIRENSFAHGTEKEQNDPVLAESSLATSSCSSSNSKIRIEIVEAIYSNDKNAKTSKKKEGSRASDKNNLTNQVNVTSDVGTKKKSKSQRGLEMQWKEGTIRKIMVLEKNTLVKEFISLCKSKLQMKKPARVFVVDRETKLEMDLLYDLSGLQNGDVVYLTTNATSSTPKSQHSQQEQLNAEHLHDFENSINTATNKGEGQETETDTETKTETVVDMNTILDPLEVVKKVYRMKKMNKKGGGGGTHDKGISTAVSVLNDRLPHFADSLDRKSVV
jgi:hypothetical protein